VNPRDRLDRIAAPDPTGPRYNRPPADSPPQPAAARIEYGKVLEIRRRDGAAWTDPDTDGFISYVLVTPSMADGLACSGLPQFWLKATGDDLNPDGLRVGMDRIEAGDIIGWVRTDKRETVPVTGTPPVRGQVVAWAGAQGATLGAVPLPPHQHHFWATITGTGPEYDFAEIGGESRTGKAWEVNGVLGIDGQVVRVFTEDGSTDFEFEYGEVDRPDMERSYETIEIWPALVLSASDPLVCRIWVPDPDGFPPLLDDDWNLTSAEQGNDPDVAYDKIGAGTFADGTLIPALRDYAEGPPEIADWIFVRCLPGAFSAIESAATPVPPDGHIKTFSGTLAAVPLPYTFTLEYEVAPGRWKRMQATRTVDAADDFNVTLEGDGTGYVCVRTGAWEVTLNDAPPAGATMRWWYVAVADCKWAWVVMAETFYGPRSVKVEKDGGHRGGAPPPDDNCTYTYTIKTLEGAVLATAVTPENPRYDGCEYNYAGESGGGAHPTPSSTYGLAWYDGAWKLFVFGESIRS
jgi:hypothetical protein